jgi:hypothetical protein
MAADPKARRSHRRHLHGSGKRVLQRRLTRVPRVMTPPALLALRDRLEPPNGRQYPHSIRTQGSDPKRKRGATATLEKICGHAQLGVTQRLGFPVYLRLAPGCATLP